MKENNNFFKIFCFFIFLSLKRNSFSFAFLNLNSNCITNRTINENIELENCLINQLFLSNGEGGAIYIIKSCHLLVYDTTFSQCMITNNGCGGAIYFQNGLDVNLFRVCASSCRAYHNQFAQIITNNNLFLELNSVSKCYNHTNYGMTPITLFNGNQSISNTNISNNCNFENSGISFEFPNNLISNYCTFFNNTVRDFVCISLYGNSGNINRCNIINNNSPIRGIICVYEKGFYFLTECIFDNNINVLLYIFSGNLTLNNCYYLSGSSSTHGYISNNLIITKTNFYSFENYNTFYCSPFFVTPFIETPKPTISETINPTNNEFKPSKTSIYIKIISYFVGITLISIFIIFYFIKNKSNQFKEII